MKARYYVLRVDFVVKATTQKIALAKLAPRIKDTLEIHASEPKLIQARNNT